MSKEFSSEKWTHKDFSWKTTHLGSTSPYNSYICEYPPHIQAKCCMPWFVKALKIQVRVAKRNVLAQLDGRPALDRSGASRRWLRWMWLCQCCWGKECRLPDAAMFCHTHLHIHLLQVYSAHLWGLKVCWCQRHGPHCSHDLMTWLSNSWRRWIRQCLSFLLQANVQQKIVVEPLSSSNSLLAPFLRTQNWTILMIGDI